MRPPLRASCLLIGLAILAAASLAAGADDMIVLSLRQWQGEYATSDIPGGVAATAFTSALYAVPADGSAPPRRLLDVDGRADAPEYSPDGQLIYFQAPADGHAQIFRCRADGTDVQNLTSAHQPPGDRFGRSISRDGKRLVFIFHDGQIGRVGIMNADGTDPFLIAPDIGYHYMAELSPDGQSVAFSHTAKGYVLALKRLDTGTLTTLTPDLPESYCPQFTPDGKTLVFFRRDGDVYSINVDGSNLRRLTNGNAYVEFRLSPTDQHGSSDPPALSPDGKRIAYVAVRNGIPQVHVMDLDGSGQRQLTFRATPCGRVAWSPDGQRLAFVSWTGKYPQLFVIPAAGGEPRQLTDLPGAVHWLAWQPTSTH